MQANALQLIVITVGSLLGIPFLVFGLHPNIQHYAEPDVVKVCGDFALYCTVPDSASKVWWTRNGTDASDLRNVTAVEQSPTPNTTTWRLQIWCAQPMHSGNYTCHMETDDSIESYSKSLIFRVADPIVIDAVPWIHSQLGQKLILNCTIRGYPLPQSISWRRNGTQVESSNLINVSQRVISTGEIASSLEILNVSDVHLGTYECLAITDIEEVKSSTEIIKGLKAPSNLNTFVINPTEVNVTWTTNSSIVPIDYFEINVLVDDETMERHVNSMDPSSLKPGQQAYKQLITELQSNKSYIFGIRACNIKIGCGKELKSDKVFLPDASSSPMDVSLTCQYDNISMVSYVVGRWMMPVFPNGEIIEYEFIIDGISNYTNSEGLTKHERVYRETLKTNQTFTKLLVEPNAKYSLRVCAVTSVGCGHKNNVSASSTCFTPPTLPLNLPYFELKKVDATEDSRQLKLNMQRISQRNGPIKCYNIILYKMKFGKQDMPQADNINLLSYQEVHKEGAYGAYIAESFNGKKYQMEVILGDEVQSQCDESVSERQQRSIISIKEPTEVVHDGELTPETYYSGFVEVKVVGKDDVVLTKRSSLFTPIKTGAVKYNLQATALGVICGLLIVIIILAVALCALSKRNDLQEYEGGFRLCHIFCKPFGPSHRRGLAGTPVLPIPDIKPLKPENLPAAFQERHKDSDLLFQREFESLPEQFRDRSTRASDMLENYFKNRYPDIRAYDQTRVKLSTVDGVAGSDYINANFVMGYKDRKKFICAQGPLEKTVNDFWRMIWEQKISLVIMVTGLEENGKMKCTKYWPDEEEKQFANITITFKEKNMSSDYVIRKFSICHKKDEDITETRELFQYHYLTWKDFLAPEHPGGILKFIKRINEAFTPDMGPILVHCSAGVGRTGTLVVIDSLLQQMKDEGQIEIFNFVVTARRQRNFLVQSLKQYIFIYRALMEFSQFGDTEMEAKELKTKWNLLSNHIRSGKSSLKAEYEKLSQIIEDVKTCDVATTDLNANKNRIPSVVPYDRNRVILTPVPSKEQSSYINASYIQGYDRNASFIITQDPMESTIGEFWRMVHEQNASVVVMLSSTSNPEYWPDQESEYDHISLKRLNVETFSHFTKREITVTNTKSSKFHSVSHYHFHDWESDIPLNTTTVLEFIKVIVSHTEQCQDVDNVIIVHCSEAGHRSAVFIACCFIYHQLRQEGRVDICQVVRNIRSQRQALFQNFESYKFCYQFALDYATNLTEE